MKATSLENKDKSFKQKVIIKSLVGLIIFVIVFCILLLIAGTDMSGKIISFIFYFSMVCFAIYEFSLILPLPKWANFYLPLLTFLTFFSSWDNLYSWFNDNNQSLSLNDLIRDQYQYKIANISGLGYLIEFALLLTPFLFAKKEIKTFLFGLITYVFITFITIAGKSLMFLNAKGGSFLFLLVLLFGPAFCDTFSYFGGILLGNKIFKNKKLAPKISPNKTIEGAIVGFIFTWLALFLFFWFINFKSLNIDKTILLIVVPITLPIIAILGDLTFSSIKRFVKTKDFSNILPEHGGILDRFDSIILVSFIFSALFLV